MKHLGNILLGLTAVITVGLSVYRASSLIPEPVEVTVSYDRALPVSSAAFDPSLIDINKASAAALDLLPGIGPVLAERIVAYREANGDFLLPEDLLSVEGIGEATLEELREYITVG